jgi:hypothetical protein
VKREIFEKLIKTLYPEQTIVLMDYNIIGRNKYEDGKWVSDSAAVFVSIKCDSFNTGDIYKTEDFLTNFTGFEFSINKI